MLVDYHIHTLFSDGICSHEEIVERAISLGVDSIGFSDHYGFYPNDWTASVDIIPEMVSEVLRCKKKYTGQIQILLGLEVDYYPDKVKETREVIEAYPFDYVMGSIHHIDGENFDSDPNHNIYKKNSIDFLYQRYYELLSEAVCSGLFNIISHPDLIKKYNYIPSIDLTKVYNDLADLLVANNIFAEYNTSGLSRPCQDFFPSDEIVSIFLKKGVKFIVGSDTHKLEHLLRNYQEAIRRLKVLGVDKLYRYDGLPISIGDFQLK
ncbi:histidinol-phosphatase [Halosquirtibacter laminarini]|uniref:Histidinol-phosphatase n=1 Tax=Halosquirtibacter laminarini TaxID=3374600 RepID=A0AC61NE13_9BACT|nr:histidinol-phosphatase [Prolixibacteraceae bacterium]